MRDDRERLLDIWEAIQKIEQYAVVEQDIPTLKAQIEKILTQL